MVSASGPAAGFRNAKYGNEPVVLFYTHIFTDHVFGLCHFLGFEFAPRIADPADKNLYVPGKAGDWPALSSLIGGSISRKLIERKFDDVVRLAASIQQGTVTASLILRKLSAYSSASSLGTGRVSGPRLSWSSGRQWTLNLHTAPIIGAPPADQ
jgi:hypothetical protein